MRSRRRDRTRAAGSGDGGQRSSQRNRADGAGTPQRNRRQQGGGGGGGGSGGSANRRRGSSGRGRRRGRGRSRAQQGAGFWGDASSLPTQQPEMRITDAPAAVPRSLGRPPLPGHEQIAEHYFGAVYERAVSTATALAAAGGLVDPETLLELERG